MTEITLDYSAPLTVRVNVDTGEVSAVWVHADSLIGTEPDEFFNNGCLDNDLPEYLPKDHPIAKRALAIAERVQLSEPEIEMPFTIEER